MDCSQEVRRPGQRGPRWKRGGWNLEGPARSSEIPSFFGPVILGAKSCDAEYRDKHILVASQPLWSRIRFERPACYATETLDGLPNINVIKRSIRPRSIEAGVIDSECMVTNALMGRRLVQ